MAKRKTLPVKAYAAVNTDGTLYNDSLGYAVYLNEHAETPKDCRLIEVEIRAVEQPTTPQKKP